MKYKGQDSVISRMYPETIFPKIPAIMPNVDAIPTSVPVAFGAISA